MTATPVEGIPPPLPAEPRPQAPRIEVVVSMRTVALGLAILLGIVLVVVVKDALLSIALAGVLVLGLDPPVSALERRGWVRGLAALAVLAAIALVVFVIVVWAVKPIWSDVREFVAKLPGYVDEVQHNEPFKSIDKDTDAFKKLESALAQAAKDIPTAAASLLGAAGSAVSALFELVTLAFLTLFGIIAKPALTQSALDLMRPATAERVDRTLGDVSRTISFALIGNVVISIIAGTVVGVTAVIVDAPSGG